MNTQGDKIKAILCASGPVHISILLHIYNTLVHLITSQSATVAQLLLKVLPLKVNDNILDPKK